LNFLFFFLPLISIFCKERVSSFRKNSIQRKNGKKCYIRLKKKGPIRGQKGQKKAQRAQLVRKKHGKGTKKGEKGPPKGKRKGQNHCPFFFCFEKMLLWWLWGCVCFVLVVRLCLLCGGCGAVFALSWL